MNANHVTIVGRLAGKPSLKGFTKADGTPGYRSFMRVAVTRLSDLGEKDREKQRTNFIPVVAWGKQAERIAQYLDTGTEVTVMGEFIAESQPILTDAGVHSEVNGVKQYRDFLYINVNSCQFGRKSMKNQSPEDLQSQLNALQGNLDRLSTGDTTAPDTSASTPETSAAPADPNENPFETAATA